MAGGKGLWVAERLGPDEIRVADPGYIGNVPPELQGEPKLLFYNIPEPEENEDIGWYYDEAAKGDIGCLAVPGVDPDLPGDVPATKWRTTIPGVENSGS